MSGGEAEQRGGKQGIRDEAEAEAEAEGRRRRRDCRRGGVAARGEGEIRIRVITALPFPSLFHLCNSPHSTLLV